MASVPSLGQSCVVSFRTGGDHLLPRAEVQTRTVTGGRAGRPQASQFSAPWAPPGNHSLQLVCPRRFPLSSECGFGVDNPLCYGARFWGRDCQQAWNPQMCSLVTDLTQLIALKKADLKPSTCSAPQDRWAELPRASDLNRVVHVNRSLTHVHTRSWSGTRPRCL